MPERALAKDRSMLGVVYGLASGVAMGVMAALVHRVNIPSSELALARAAVGLVVFIPVSLRELPRVVERAALPLWGVALGGMVSILAFFYNLQHTSIGTANTLLNLSPAFVAALSIWPLRQRVQRRTILGIAIALAGVITLNAHRMAAPSLTVLVIGIAGAVAAALAYLALREASQRFSASVVVIAISAAMAVAAVLLPRPSWGLSSLSDAGVLVAVGACGTVGHLTMTRSFRFLSATVASGLTLTSVLWAILLAVSWGEVPTAFEWSAYTLVIVGAVVLNSARRAPIEPAATPQSIDPTSQSQ